MFEGSFYFCLLQVSSLLTEWLTLQFTGQRGYGSGSLPEAIPAHTRPLREHCNADTLQDGAPAFVSPMVIEC